uniref:Carboxylesterase type B domain-containing protein n=1 Tax=Chaetoceros debilis TaxID=122233 RepID=A0A7S3PU08_9STRA|mmetsp:Transcript_22243/g.33907  ORF Transcript_22243/g.33907 Transcript_22243/m.33907 type:complete len:1033 (+) Transcript_22243:183-3281(+)
MDGNGRNKTVFKHLKKISSLCLLFVAIACLLHVGSADRSGDGDHPILTDEMIELIKSVKAGGYTNDLKKPALKKKRRTSKAQSSSQSPNSSRKKSTPHDPSSTEVTVIIPGFGKASGRRESGVDVWKGLPYASPPVGSLRFAPPEAVTPWAPSKLDASKYGPDCYQLVDPVLNPLADANHMSEDCLYLNVFTPAGHVARSRPTFISTIKRLPVMLWFHGGAFQQGAARRPEYDGRKLAERDIIIVSINYRLGALGFLVSSRDGLYGNFGLMDQRAALEWVKNNIEAFGGDPDNICLFGESAGAVMIGLHLLMEGAGELFHKAIMQSNPVGYTFRSVVVADFIGEALKKNVDCRDLACLRAERVEEIMRAQASLMGVPRSVGDFFTFSPTLTSQRKLKLSLSGSSQLFSRSEENRLPRLDTAESQNSYVSEWRISDDISSDSARWSAVNVSQPMLMLDKIPDDIPIIIGTNKEEGEMFVHSAFPAPMPKAVYWMFVGALFRDSASRVLRHYRGLVEEVEREAEELARKELEEEENKQNYLENKEELDTEYDMLLALNKTRRTREEDMAIIGSEGLQAMVKTWSTGGAFMDSDDSGNSTSGGESQSIFESDRYGKRARKTWRDRFVALARNRENKRISKMKQRALKEAAKVVVDYRPVMSAIINDYLFRCPSWHFAQLLTRNRSRRGRNDNNVYVYRFSLPTHIPGYKECWGKSCHTSELPYVFQSMDVIRSNYSTLGPFAQEEAPSAPEYPFTQIMAAYRGALEAIEQFDDSDVELESERSVDANGMTSGRNHTKAFQRILNHFFGDYFKEDADEEMATDMSERWASFARNSYPNYDGNKADWLPWRHKSENSTFFNDGEDEGMWSKEASFWPDEEYDEWTDEYDEFSDDTDDDIASRDDYYRRRALEAMEMDVAAEDVFTTELRRVKYKKEIEDEDVSFLGGSVLKRLYHSSNRPRPMHHMSKNSAREAIRLAQEFGLLGMGLSEDEAGGGYPMDASEIFFPELFEFTWPPEARLIERDCTCDLWDRIRYRY